MANADPTDRQWTLVVLNPFISHNYFFPKENKAYEVHVRTIFYLLQLGVPQQAVKMIIWTEDRTFYRFIGVTTHARCSKHMSIVCNSRTRG